MTYMYFVHRELIYHCIYILNIHIYIVCTLKGKYKWNKLINMLLKFLPIQSLSFQYYFLSQSFSCLCLSTQCRIFFQVADTLSASICSFFSWLYGEVVNKRFQTRFMILLWKPSLNSVFTMKVCSCSVMFP